MGWILLGKKGVTAGKVPENDAIMMEPQPIDPLNGNGGNLALSGLTIDKSCRTVVKNGVGIRLTSAEFDLLWYLAVRAGQVVSREELFTQMLGLPYNGLNRTIDIRISRLRRRLGEKETEPPIIKAVRSEGYCLTVERQQ